MGFSEEFPYFGEGSEYLCIETDDMMKPRVNLNRVATVEI